MRALLSANRIDSLAPLITDVFDGMQYEYVHLTKEGGCRVFMNNPGDEPSGADAIYVDLVDFFGRWPSTAESRKESDSLLTNSPSRDFLPESSVTCFGLAYSLLANL